MPSVGGTSTIVPNPFTSGDNNDIGAPAPTTTEPPSDSQPTEEPYPCDLPDPPDWCNPPDFVQPDLPTATGWDDWGEWNNDGISGGGGQDVAPTTTWLRPIEQTPDLITTNTPTIIEIRTSVEPSATKTTHGGISPEASTSEPAGDGRTEKQEKPGKSSAEQDMPQTGGLGGVKTSQVRPAESTNGQPAPAQPSADSRPNTVDDHVSASQRTASTGNSLLDTIIDRLGKAQPGAQPTSGARPTAGVPGERIDQEPQAEPPTSTARLGQNGSVQSGGLLSGPVTPGTTNTATPQDSLAVDNTITLGSATLSLTPGLSIIVGTGTDTTLIAIQTDSASHTIITISSSGTAITATITNAPATVTLPKSGWDASITGEGGRGVRSTRVAVTAVSTSSKGGANARRANVGGLTGLIIGVLSFLSAL